VEFEIRELRHPDELKDVIRLQAAVGGLPPEDTMSPITLSAMTMERPRVGWILGAYHGQKMISFLVALATAEPGAAFGHMVGVLEDYRNSSVGRQIIQRNLELFRRDGISRVYTTFEPLESRNAHIYINKMGGSGIVYKEAHYYIDSGLHHGMPQDRLLVALDVNYDPAGSRAPDSLPGDLDRHPIATAESMPDARVVLMEIPADVQGLKKEDPAGALAWRMNTRAVFQEYMNNRGMVAEAFFSEVIDGKRRSFYRLCRR